MSEALFKLKCLECQGVNKTEYEPYKVDMHNSGNYRAKCSNCNSENVEFEQVSGSVSEDDFEPTPPIKDDYEEPAKSAEFEEEEDILEDVDLKDIIKTDRVKADIKTGKDKKPMIAVTLEKGVIREIYDVIDSIGQKLERKYTEEEPKYYGSEIMNKIYDANSKLFGAKQRDFSLPALPFLLVSHFMMVLPSVFFFFGSIRKKAENKFRKTGKEE